MRLISLFIFIFSIPMAQAQIQVFQEYDFSEGGYTLIGLDWGMGAVEAWYSDDIALLDTFKSAWVFKKTQKAYACGYHYEVLLCKNGRALRSFFINLECKLITMDEGYFYFKPNKLLPFLDQCSKPQKKMKASDNLEAARAYYDEILNDPELIYAAPGDWLKYEGEFDLAYSKTYPLEVYLNHLDFEDEIMAVLRNIISENYPQEPFELHLSGIESYQESQRGFVEYIFTVKSNKSLAIQFDLFPRKFKEWEAYNFDLLTYWKN